MNLADADQPTAELVKLAQRELSGDSVLSDDAGFARLEARMTKPRAFWVTRPWLPAGLGLASVALAAALLIQPGRNALTYEVAGASRAESGHIVAKEATRIRFSDGSEASLSNGAEAQIQNVTEHGAEVVLQRGTMRVKIAKQPQAAWKVAAGPYDVQVTGTAFDVSWSSQTQTFDLRMQTGAVIVTGPLAQSGILLKAGQHMFGGVAEGRLTVEGGETAASPEPAKEAATAPSPEPKSATAAQLAPSSGVRSTSEPHAWTRQVAQGNFNAVLEEAEQRGLSRTLDAGSLEELAALADAARYAGRSAIAKRVLLAERQRFPNSSAARDAAFFLGRIAEDGGGGAIEWYERYVAESPRGAYASQAFGRKMMLLYKQRGVAAARPVAAEYLARYPNGPYAAAARKLEQESSPAKQP